MCQKKSAILACLAMSKLKMNQRVPNKNTDLLKKNQLNENTETKTTYFFKTKTKTPFSRPRRAFF